MRRRPRGRLNADEGEPQVAANANSESRLAALGQRLGKLVLDGRDARYPSTLAIRFLDQNIVSAKLDNLACKQPYLSGRVRLRDDRRRCAAGPGCDHGKTAE
ncbi:MAG: hypothetical protein FJ029_11115 [Actinobacteria bacterium]|nr:hypothetical protein [Actinomycetota bacterium]